jgi:transcriptional regulator with XRE-family HTH domain
MSLVGDSVRPSCEHMFVKPALRAAARALRREEGLPLSAIAARLGVAKSSVSIWTRDIELSPEQHAALRALNPIYDNQLRGQEGRRASALAARSEAQRHGRELARRADPLHVKGCMLYWAEGTKRRNTAIFVNSDLNMVRLFLRFLRECYGVVDDRVALSVNCYETNGMTAGEITAWWLSALGLPDSCARQPRSTAGSIAPPGSASSPAATRRASGRARRNSAARPPRRRGRRDP